ncbi:nucleoside recognition domain-containing protein [Ruminococcus sp. NK3A76]|uniref:nucleoside recognition domain-containing protein n=1 Tax=Ruminococcus sp. NK3A76 TaxID=877411 RepID=UPI00048E2FC9|nr:nucleoside recognition domain-containing protein [Ruminococcus sp. NK3A76]
MTGELFAVGVICFICIYGLAKDKDIFSAFTEGAKENAKAAFDIFPALLMLLTAVSMLRASGAIDFLADKLSLVFASIGFPAECLPLVMIRGISGSGALAVLGDILSDVSPDSFTGRVASVMMGSTETTFYTIAVYFSAVKLRCTGKTVIPAVTADIFGFIFSVIFVRLLF